MEPPSALSRRLDRRGRTRRVAIARRQASAAGPRGAKPSPSFGQPIPGLTTERFAAGVIGTAPIEPNAVFAPDLRASFFAWRVDGIRTMHRAVPADGAWSAPGPLLLFPNPARAVAVDLTLSPDESWRSRRIDAAWSTAEALRSP